MNLRTLPALLLTVLLLGGTAACSDDAEGKDSSTRSSTPNAGSAPSDGSTAGSTDGGSGRTDELDDLLLTEQDDVLVGTRVVPPDAGAQARGPEDSALCPPLTFTGTTDRAERQFRWGNGEEVVLELRDLGTEEAAEDSFADLPGRLLTCLEEHAVGSDATVRAGTSPGVGDASLSIVVTATGLQVEVVAARVGSLVVSTGASVSPETSAGLAADALRAQVARISTAG